VRSGRMPSISFRKWAKVRTNDSENYSADYKGLISDAILLLFMKIIEDLW